MARRDATIRELMWLGLLLVIVGVIIFLFITFWWLLILIGAAFIIAGLADRVLSKRR